MTKHLILSAIGYLHSSQVINISIYVNEINILFLTPFHAQIVWLVGRKEGEGRRAISVAQSRL